MKPTIFVVEDDPDISRLIRFHLQQAGYTSECFPRGSAALSRAAEVVPALLLLDIMLPGEDGLELCRRIRKTPELSATPIIFVTAKISEEDRLRGFECGADDYITKPFSPRELVARVRVALRRSNNRPVVLKFGNFEVDTGAMALRVRGREQKTTAMEFRILEALVRSPGRVFSRERLLQLAGSDARDASPRTIDVYVSRIREKIEPDPEHPRYVHTVRSAGYRFITPHPGATAHDS